MQKSASQKRNSPLDYSFRALPLAAGLEEESAPMQVTFIEIQQAVKECLKNVVKDGLALGLREKVW